MAAKLKTVICLFRNDLRVHDNESLLWAHKTGDFVVPLYCFDPDHFRETWNFKFPKTGPHRSKFIVESVQNLKENLNKKKSDLIIEIANPVDSVKRIVEHCKNTKAPVRNVVYQKEVTYEEVQVESSIKYFCESQNINILEMWGSTMYHQLDLPFKNRNSIPDTYTQFRKEVESKSKVRQVLAMPDTLKPLPPGLTVPSFPDLTSLAVEKHYTTDPRTAFPFSGGETAGLERLHDYLWGSNCVAKYKETRNGLVGQEYSTKLSPWLGLGCVSPRMVFQQIKRYEKEKVANQSTYWVIFELIWRDYFKFVCQKYGDRVFYQTGILNKNLPWSQDVAKFQAWAEGRTGIPFVDANMRELKLTGWMSNRGRQNVASFLVKDLGLDWRLGAEWFESQLMDHDVCSNYGNWNYAAGIGNDPRENRKFNMIKQGLDYDGDGEFVRLWIEELGGIKGGKVHVPWTLSAGVLAKLGVELGVTYPKPLLIAPEWSKYTKFKENDGTRSQNAPLNGQKGINFYFKAEEKGKSTVTKESMSSGTKSGGHRGRGGRPPLGRGRVQ